MKKSMWLMQVEDEVYLTTVCKECDYYGYYGG